MRDHRSKNMLSVVQAIVRHTAAPDPEVFIGHFTERIQALAANQDLLIRNEWQGVDIEDLARAQLAHFADLVGSRIAVDGPKLRLNAAAAQAIGLSLHELATNAGKYGALSADAGCIDVCWRLDGDVFWVNSFGLTVTKLDHLAVITYSTSRSPPAARQCDCRRSHGPVIARCGCKAAEGASRSSALAVRASWHPPW
jgi:two-component sensor histidine kinase